MSNKMIGHFFKDTTLQQNKVDHNGNDDNDSSEDSQDNNGLNVVPDSDPEEEDIAIVNPSPVVDQLQQEKETRTQRCNQQQQQQQQQDSGGESNQ